MVIYKRLTVLLALFCLFLIGGAFSYTLVEGEPWSFLDGLYMTVLTISTVGYGEVHPLTENGKMLTIVIIGIGVTFVAYAASTTAQMIFEGKLKEFWGVTKMMNKVNALKNHYIICGAGKTAYEIIKCLEANKVDDFLVIDINKERVAKLRNSGILTIEGDATNDKVLIEAGVERAVGLAATLPTDADNVFVALSARTMKDDLLIVAKAEKIESIAKLRRAGANRVVSPNIIAGARMASMLYRPSVVDFMDAAMAGDGNSMQMEEFRLQKNSFLDGKILKNAQIRQKSGAIVVSVRSEKETIINPLPEYKFKAFDNLVILGTSEQVRDFAVLTKTIKEG